MRWTKRTILGDPHSLVFMWWTDERRIFWRILCSNTQRCFMEVSSRAHWYIVTSNLCLSAGVEAQPIPLCLAPYCTDCHADPLCDLQRGWMRIQSVHPITSHCVLSVHTQKTQACQSCMRLVGGAQSHRDICTVCRGHSLQMGIGIDFLLTLRACIHKCTSITFIDEIESIHMAGERLYHS